MAAFNIARIYRQRPLPAGMAEFGGAINVIRRASMGTEVEFRAASIGPAGDGGIRVNRFARVATYMRHYGFNG